MNKVTTINLAGRAYQLEEAGYERLRRYLDDAADALADNPDKDEILGDLEAALSEKCQACLNGHKDVVTAAEVDAMLAHMGPVRGDETGEAEPAGGASGSTPPAAPKRLYRVQEGEWISGVCMGLAAYFNVDVVLVRVVFVLLTVLTHGAMAFVYFVMMMIIPHAETPQQRAAAFGARPLTARDIVDRAHEGMKNSDEWKRWRHQLRQESRHWRQELRRMHDEHRARRWAPDPRQPQWQRSPFWEFANNVLGLVWLLFVAFCIWWAYGHIAPAHQFIDLLPQWGAEAWQWAQAWWAAHVH